MNGSKRISILGCGWLGWELAKFLIPQGYQVQGSTTNTEKIPLLEKDGIIAHHIDLSEELRGEHQAFFQSDVLVVNIPPGRRQPEYLKQYPTRIQRAIAAADQYGCKIIYISSTGVYESKIASAPTWDFPIYVDQMPNATGRSADVLRIAESVIADAPMESTILRFGGLVGGDRKAGRFLAGKKSITNGMSPVNMIHRDDCIRIIHAIIRQDAWGNTWNAVADTHPTRVEFYTAQAKKYGFETPDFLEQFQAEGKIVSNERLKKELAYTFMHPDPILF